MQQDGTGTPPLAAGRASGKCNGSQGMDPEGNILAEVHTGTSQESHGGSGPEGPGGRPGQLGQALGPMSACFSEGTGELLSRECHDKLCPLVSLWSLCAELAGASKERGRGLVYRRQESSRSGQSVEDKVAATRGESLQAGPRCKQDVSIKEGVQGICTPMRRSTPEPPTPACAWQLGFHDVPEVP